MKVGIIGAAACLLAAPLAAQGVTVKGIAWDSLHARPLGAAFVSLAGTTKSGFTDSTGAFTLTGVAPGSHRVLMQHDALDALGIPVVGTRALVTDGRDRVIVAVPSFATLWKAACGGTPAVSHDTGFVFGTVRLPENLQREAITVSISWLDIAVDSAKKVKQKQFTMEVDADSTGAFALCGVPTTTGLTLYATMGLAKSGPIEVDPMDKERIVRVDPYVRKYD
jgi:hypothetical protein